MPKNPTEVENAKKTGIILGIANLILFPFYYADTRWGLIASLAVSSAAMYYLHDLGKSRRPGSNALHQVGAFFSAQSSISSSEIDNAFQNLINGGALIYDECASGTSPKGHG